MKLSKSFKVTDSKKRYEQIISCKISHHFVLKSHVEETNCIQQLVTVNTQDRESIALYHFVINSYSTRIEKVVSLLSPLRSKIIIAVDLTISLHQYRSRPMV